MKKNFMTTLLGSGIAILLVASLGQARMNTATVDIVDAAQIGEGTILKPGTYRVELLTNSQSPELGFYQNRKQVAETPVKLVPSQTTNTQTEVQYNTASNPQVMTEVDFRGSNQRVVLEDSQPAK
ncbi:MAG TPA: hypothetical protein VG206_26435 [Terriglobia bacterium]|nr:hypothetical protein [Terriglobia bacterium]